MFFVSLFAACLTFIFYFVCLFFSNSFHFCFYHSLCLSTSFVGWLVLCLFICFFIFDFYFMSSSFSFYLFICLLTLFVSLFEAFLLCLYVCFFFYDFFQACFAFIVLFVYSPCFFWFIYSLFYCGCFFVCFFLNLSFFVSICCFHHYLCLWVYLQPFYFDCSLCWPKDLELVAFCDSRSRQVGNWRQSASHQKQTRSMNTNTETCTWVNMRHE